ncbi:hypothetical protein HG263_06315 [Pseudoalteromonas sp. JBTF-M23]|uniref:Lipoprotein n=1 Tax=Pseudoalteromonas caenipelagi TaxID=2726988 RepID=A0A849VDZ0_9GAMM|nr:hypothetical protein [Pseudoalteromonas caenipelagi]NOU50154.1 hypothetical protein [Pseudoalteromonas caenipelagi]
MYKTIRKPIITIASVLLLNGCAAVADSMSKMAGIGVVTEEVSTFDNATIVNMSPAFLHAEGSWGNNIKLGARWSSKSPDYAALVLSYSSDVSSSRSAYLNLSGLDINIDGKITSYKTGRLTNHEGSDYNNVTRTIYTKSENAVVVPYSILEQMVEAKDCRLRIHTSKGYEDAQFSIERIPGGQGTAILPMREFVANINSKTGKL